MVEDWISNAYEGMSRRQFLARMTAAGATVAGFAIASKAVAGEIITTPADGLAVTDDKVGVGGFQVPIYEAHPAAPGKYPVVIVIPEIWGMHEYIKDVVRRLAKRGFLAVTFEPYAREGGVLHLPDIQAVLKVANAVPDAQAMADLTAIVAYVKKLPAARADRIGVTGFCRGGTVHPALRGPEPRRESRRSLVRPDQACDDSGHPYGRAARSGGSDQGARAGALRRRRPGHSGRRRQGNGVRPQGGRQDSRVRDLFGCAPRLPRGLPAQLP